MMAILDFQAMAALVAGRMLNSTVEGLSLAALSWAILRLFRVRSAKTRFTVWFVTLLATVSLPFMAHAGHGASLFGQPKWLVPSTWALGFSIGWATIAALLLLRLALSLWQIERQRRECHDIDSAFGQLLVEALAQSGLKRRVRFCSSTAVAVPTTIGFSRPTVILPPWVLNELSSEELKLVLLHELAHLGRGDDWTNLFQKLAKSLYFFHPAFYWIEARLALEREMACDERVLEETRNPHAYARSLVSLAERTLAARSGLGQAWALAQSALGQVRHASLRMLAILRPGRRDQDPGRRPAVLAIGAVVAITLIAAPYAPELIVFGEPRRVEQAGTAARALAPGNPAQPTFAARVVNRLARPADSAVVPVRAKARLHPRPALVLAKARSEAAVQPDGMVVIETSSFDSSGAIRSRVCVWRVRFDDRSPQRITEMIVLDVI